MKVLELTNVTKEYTQGKMQVPALRGVNLSVEAGEFLSFAGPSGSGKTTLLNLIGCLDRPTAGSIELAGRELAKLTPLELAKVRRQEIGFIFQSFNLIPVLTAYENVEMPLVMLNRFTPAEIREKVMAALGEVGLAGLESRRPAELSGGQQQRVAIARALIKNPKFVLADEPTANLDSENGQAVLDLMARMNQKNGVTFIFSTHDPMVMGYARRLIRLKDGRIASDEEVDRHAKAN